MWRPLCVLCFGVFVLTMGVRRSEAQAGVANDAASVWNAINEGALNPEKAASVENLELTRDRIRITLKDGTLEFTSRVNGIVFGAAFKGEGKIEIAPPNAVEQQQLELFTKQKTLDLDFTDATFSFTDATFDEIAKQVKWMNATDNSLAQLYQSRQRDREDLDAEMVPRIFEGVVSENRQQSAYFAADLKTSNLGWVLARYDALNPEEISVGRYVSRGTPALLFDTWMSFPAGGVSALQVDQEPLAKDVFLVKSYDIDTNLTGGADMNATAKVNLQYQKASEKALVFYLSANLRVSSVKDDKGVALPFFQPREPKDRFPTYGDYVAVVLPQPTQAGQQATLTFEYAGKHFIDKVGAGNYFCPSYGWYPGTVDEFATRANFAMTFHTPKRLVLVATGDKDGQSTDGKMVTTRWKSPMPQAVSGFAFGDYKEFDQKVGNISVEAYGNQSPDDFLSTVSLLTQSNLPGQQGTGVLPSMGSLNPSDMLKTTGIEIGNDLRVFENYFGPFPFTRLAVTNIPYSYGQGWPMLLYLSVLSFMDETQRHILGISDQVRISDFFRAHEVSHQWWGHEVGWKTYHDQWLSEGFAQFSGNLYVEIRDGQKKYLDRLHTDRDELLQRNQFGHEYDSLGPIWMGQRIASSVAPSGYQPVIYNKGGYVLEMLRAMLQDPHSKAPDQNFKEMMQDFTKTFAGKAASTEDFEAVADRHMARAMDLDGNHKMDWFFNEYVYRTGIPEYHMDYTVKSEAGNKWLLSGTVTQSGVPEGWKDILPLYLHVGNKSGRIGWLSVKSKSTPFEVTLGFKPDKVSLNDNSEILAQMK
ncbi:MAG TPA: M1 family aminopeptidase [Verrucomicrobiae bacterium]|nr:M1 family aminopeptidase [Verrucomicrobiae bacterium]